MLVRGMLRELDEEQVDEVGEGAAAGSFGLQGKPGHLVREKEDEDDAESDIEELLECRLSGLEVKSDVTPNRDRAGDVAREWVGELDLEGNFGEGFDNISTSFRTTMRERCSLLLASRSDT